MVHDIGFSSQGSDGLSYRDTSPGAQSLGDYRTVHTRGGHVPSLSPSSSQVRPLKRAWTSRGASAISQLIVRGPRWSWWTLEIAAGAVSIIGAVLMIILLVKVDGQNQANWTFFITLNTLVAILSTAIRAAILIAVGGGLGQCAYNWFVKPDHSKSGAYGKPIEDLEVLSSAAQDSWGSLRVLVLTRGVHLASLGASITILTLAFDAFSQQILDTEWRTTVNPAHNQKLHTALAVPRANNFPIGYIAATGSDEELGSTSLPFMGAMYSGFFGNNLKPPFPECATGNCTYPLTPTLGVCASCFDLSSLISKRKLNATTIAFELNLPRNASMPKEIEDSRPSGFTGSLDPTVWNYTSTYPILIDRSESNNFSSFFQVISSMDNPFIGLNPNYTGKGPIYLARYTIYGVPPSKLDGFYEEWGNFYFNRSSDFEKHMVAYSCSLQYCLQSIHAKYDTGKFSQEVVQTWDKMEESHIDDMSYSFTEVPDSMAVENPYEYNITFGNITSAGGAFYGKFEFNLQEYSAEGDIEGPSMMPDRENMIFRSILYSASNSTSTIRSVFNNLAISFTNYARVESRAPDNKQFAGQVLYTGAFVSVKWLWLIYPASLLVAAWLFLAATIIQTRRRGLKAWKTTRLPLLYADVDESVRRHNEGGHLEPKGYVHRSGYSGVHLVMTEKGLSFLKP